MRASRFITGAAVVLGALIIHPATALADTSVAVGPARQTLEAGETQATVQVSNPITSAKTVTVMPDQYAYSEGEEWQPGGTGMTFNPPGPYTLAPGQYVNVTVTITRPDEACSLLGATFVAHPVGAAEGNVITYLPSVVAQIVVRNAEATDAQCLAVLPSPVVSPDPLPYSDSGPFPWWLLAIPAVLLVAAGVVYRRR